MIEQDPLPATPVEEVEPVEAAAQPPPPPVRARKVYSGMWGPAEIIVMAAGILSIVAVIVFYVLGVVPSSREVARNRSEADRLDAEVQSARSKYGEITNTSEQVDKIVSSVDDFETRILPAQSNGLAALYQRLNGLIRGYGLVNTTGPDYQPMAAADMTKPGQESTEDEKGRAKFRSLYPGVYVSTTVEGSYQNLRRFIREIESGREFVIISTIELAPSDSDTQSSEENTASPADAERPAVMPGIKTSGKLSPAAPRPPSPAESKGKMHGERVALHIEMAAYFRRPDYAPMSPQFQQ
jgi:hypothetical protein